MNSKLATKVFYFTWILLLVSSLFSISLAAAPTSADNKVVCLEDNFFTFAASDFPFSDPDIGESLQSITITDLPDKGDLYFNGSVILSIGQVITTEELDKGSLQYLPAENENGEEYDTFQFTISDGVEESISPNIMTINVTAINDAPEFSILDSPPAINENDGPQTINNFASSITDGDPEVVQNLDFIISSTGTSGNISFDKLPAIDASDGTLTYAVTDNTNGSAFFTAILEDDGGTANGGENQSNEIMFSISVNSVNSPPTINPIADPSTINEDATPASITLSGISAGINEDQTLEVSASSTNTTLIADINVNYTSPASTGSLSYTLNPNQFGTAIIKVQVTESDPTASTTEQFTVTVVAVADDPSITNASTNQGEQTTSGLVISRNVADGTEVSHFKITNIINGTLYLNNGTTIINENDFISFSQGSSGLKFTPSSTADGSFNIQASTSDNDAGLGGSKVKATISVNSKPTSSGFSPINVDEDGTISSINLYNIFDDDEDKDNQLTLEITSNTNPQLFSTVSISSNLLLMTLKENASGSSDITIKCTDTNGASVQDILNVTVNPVNDKPTFTSTPVTQATEDFEYVYNIKVSDVENQTLTIQAITKPSWLSLVDNGNGTAKLSGTPHQENVGTYNIDITATDTQNGTTHQTFTIEVVNLNEKPRITSTPIKTIEETVFYSYKITTYDPDVSDQLTITVQNPSSLPLWLKLTDLGDGTALLTGTPPVGAFGQYSITVIVKDEWGLSDQQTFTISVTTKNNLPVLDNITKNNKLEDKEFSFTIADFKDHFSDVDGDTLQNIKIVSLPENGSLSVSGKQLEAGDTVQYRSIPFLKYLPNKDYYGFDDFQWNGFDGKHYSITAARVNITIIAVNDPPEIRYLEEDPLYFGLGDDGQLITNLAEVVDVDGDKLEHLIISFSDYYLHTEDSLAFEEIDGINIRGNWVDSTGTLILSGITTPQNYQQVLRTIQYVNLHTLNPDITPRTISIVAYDSESESIPAERTIEFEDRFVELDIPTGFTPNNDEVNDTWNILNIDRYDDSKVTVFARNGEIVFESDGYEEEWDGTYKGKILPRGVYYYYIRIDKYKKTYKGSITIL